MTEKLKVALAKHCGKRRKCWLPAFSPFPTVFSRAFLQKVVKSHDCLKKLKPNALECPICLFPAATAALNFNHTSLFCTKLSVLCATGLRFPYSTAVSGLCHRGNNTSCVDLDFLSYNQIHSIIIQSNTPTFPCGLRKLNFLQEHRDISILLLYFINLHWKIKWNETPACLHSFT